MPIKPRHRTVQFTHDQYAALQKSAHAKNLTIADYLLNLATHDGETSAKAAVTPSLPAKGKIKKSLAKS